MHKYFKNILNKINKMTNIYFKIKLILITIKALDPELEKLIIDKIYKIPDLKLVYTTIIFNPKKLTNPKFNTKIETIFQILKQNCQNRNIHVKLKQYKHIINQNNTLKLPNNNFQIYFELVQYVTKFSYYSNKIDPNFPKKIHALEGLLLLDYVLENY